MTERPSRLQQARDGWYITLQTPMEHSQRQEVQWSYPLTNDACESVMGAPAVRLGLAPSLVDEELRVI